MSARWAAVAAVAIALALVPLFGRGDAVPLRVGTAADYPPLSFMEGGEARGAEVDFARRLGRELQREPQIVRLAWADLIPALREGRIDIIMSGMSITPDRSSLVRFCAPYLQVGQMALIRTAEWAERSAPEAMGRKTSRVGFVVQTTGEKFARAQLAGAQLAGLPSIGEGIAALRAGRIDYFVHDAPSIWRVVGGFQSNEDQLTGLYTPLTDEYLAWAVRREEGELAQRIDALLAGWKHEGFVDEVLDLWMPVRKISVRQPSP